MLPIDKDDFRKIREGEVENYYVDKTLMIRDFIEYGSEVTLITRPRRFGKTLNMTILRDFLVLRRIVVRFLWGLRLLRRSMPSR